MSSTTADVRASMPHVSMIAAAPLLVDDAPLDNEKCTICNESGILTQCDECHEWNHWHCVDKCHQPTSGGKYLCGKCRDTTGRHPVAWANMAILHLDCIVCHEKKPATEFVHKILPVCPCHASRPKLCALCAYNMAEKADAYNTEAKCPTCRKQWSAFFARPTEGASDEIIWLGHARGTDTFDELPAAAPVPVDASETTEYDLMQWLENPTGDPPEGALAGMAAFSEPPDAMQVDDSDSDSDSDYQDSVIGEDNPNPDALALSRSGRGSRCYGTSSKPNKTISKKTTSKKGPASERAKDIKLNRDKASFDTSKLKNPKMNPPVRIAGSTMRRVTDAGRKRSHYDTDARRESILRKIFDKFDADEISDPDQFDASAISAHCRVLAIRDGLLFGEKGDSSAAKYCGYVAKFVSATGFALKSEFVKGNKLRAKGIAKKIGNDIVAANPALKTSAAKYAKNHMAGFRLYCKLLEKENAGTINADPPAGMVSDMGEEGEEGEEGYDSD